MGTFHDGKHELHGITVVVDTPGAEVYIGRCDDIDDRGIVLLDVDVHRDGDGGWTKMDWVRQAARVGVWVRHRRVVVPLAEIESVKPLGQIADE